MFSRKFGLYALRRTVAKVASRGVAPTRDAMVLTLAALEAVGVRVTVREEGKVEIERQKTRAKMA
ncbi:hypothetical protein HYT01_02215 [Candidatus Giovannonibacteria bacterium]|nr:hypothetical protein [Candidatus Giovannonibacteria bacterium]